jgi:adenylate kinase family enzyme
MIMVDGFPRAMEQAKFMLKKMEEYQRDFVVIHLQLPKDKAIERMVKRAEIEGRDDDTIEAMHMRIDTFVEETLPVISYLESMGKVINVNADGSIEDVQKELKQKLGL